jgi:glyoxylase-like metal-dependent hydrolase (beta-lactamase superfamily II)
MKQLADGVWQLRGFPPNAINVYVIDDVLVDAATRHATRRILRELDGRAISAHALTHAHPDHQGASHDVCERLGIPFWVGDGDVAAAENPDLIRERQPDHPIARIFVKAMTGPGHPVDRRLAEGDEVAGFTVLDVPGHSAGHVAFWRESDRVLILGDVLNNIDVLTGIPGLRLPKDFLTPDPVLNRRSAQRLGALEPSLVLFGHGAPLRDTRKFVDFCAALAD